MSDDVLIATTQDRFWREIETLLFHHTNPWELDEALVAWGFTMGPCEAQDLVGLDVVRNRQGSPVTPVLPRMVAEGRMGKKGGVGFYRYPGSGGAVIDPLIEDLIREEAWFAKLDRIELSDEALVDKVLDVVRKIRSRMGIDGVSDDKSDAVLVRGLHFPKARLSEIQAANV